MSIIPLILFIIFMLGAMFFSASETAFTAIPQHKVNALLKQRKKGAKKLYKLKQQPEKVLTSILIGSNIANIGAASVATIIAVNTAHFFSQPQNTIVSISTIIVTILMLIFGEIFPKTFATHNAEKVALTISPFYNMFIKILAPIIIILTFITNIFQKKTSKTMTSEDLEAFIKLSKQHGVLEHQEDLRIKKLLKLDELTAEEIMTPRIKIKAIKDNLTIEQAIKKMTKTPYSRFPIYYKSIDDTDRMTTLKELIRFQEKYGKETKLKDIAIDSCIKIPTSQHLNTILGVFQKTHKHLGLVMNGYNSVVGVVSLEDILEEVFGEIQDEVDHEEYPIKIINRNTIVCKPYVRIDEMLDALHIDFHNLEIHQSFESASLNYFITKYFDRFPQQGETITLPLLLQEDISQELNITVSAIKDDIIIEIIAKKQQKKQQKK